MDIRQQLNELFGKKTKTINSKGQMIVWLSHINDPFFGVVPMIHQAIPYIDKTYYTLVLNIQDSKGLEPDNFLWSWAATKTGSKMSTIIPMDLIKHELKKIKKEGEFHSIQKIKCEAEFQLEKWKTEYKDKFGPTSIKVKLLQPSKIFKKSEFQLNSKPSDPDNYGIPRGLYPSSFKGLFDQKILDEEMESKWERLLKTKKMKDSKKDAIQTNTQMKLKKRKK